MIFFTADNHFGHKNILKYANRPFSSVEEMDNVMIECWNEVVSEKDTVYHLGDFTLGNENKAIHYLSQLNGTIYALDLPFHHDRWWQGPASDLRTKTGVCRLISPVYVIDRVMEPKIIVLSHYPFATWDRRHYGAIHLHGHTHGVYKSRGRIMDVGVDCHNFCPVSLDEVWRVMRFK